MAANLRKFVSTKSLVSLRGILNDGEASGLLERLSTNVTHPLGGRVAGRELEAGFKLHYDRKSAKVPLFPYLVVVAITLYPERASQVSLVARSSALSLPSSTSTQSLSKFIQVIRLYIMSPMLPDAEISTFGWRRLH